MDIGGDTIAIRGRTLGTDRTSTLRNIKVVGRVGLLIGLGVCALIALAVMTKIGDLQRAKAVAHEQAFIEIERLVLKADAGALMLRRREKDFLLRSDLKYHERYRADSATLLAVLNDVKAFPQSAGMLASIDGVIAKLKEHRDQFDYVVDMSVRLGLSEKEGLKGSLRKAVHRVESKLKEFDQDGLTVKMLMMRRHEKDFMLRGAEKYLGRIVTRREEFDPMLAEANIPLDDKTDIARLMDTYQAEMKAYGNLAIARVPEIKRLSAIYAEMAPDFKTLDALALEGAEQARASAERVIERVGFFVLMAAISAGIVLVGLGFIIMRSITRPIVQLTGVTEDLAEGNLDVDIPDTSAKDEIGTLARAVEVFKHQMEENENLKAQQSAAAEETQKQQHLARLELANAFEASVGGIVSSVSGAAGQVQTSSEHMSAKANHSVSEIATASDALEKAAENVQAVAAATEELTSSIKEIYRQVHRSSDVAANAVQEAEKTNNQVRGLSEAANSIGDVLSLISDIAEQTNLLALNATIEAARAGEAGKGFAVVASEVKNLANQTAKATEEISKQISGIQDETVSAVSAITEISNTIDEISQITAIIASSVEEQNAAIDEISRNVHNAAAATSEVSGTMGGIDHEARDNGRTADELQGAARSLSDESQNLSEELQSFLNRLRTNTA